MLEQFLASLAGASYERVMDSSPARLVLVQDQLNPSTILNAVRAYCPEIFPTAQFTGAYVAGGFVRDVVLGDRPRDLDLYVWNSDVAAFVEERLRSSSWRLDQCAPVVTTWRDAGERTVQVIRTEHQQPADCISRFDLTVCCAAFDLANQAAICSTDFLTHIKGKELVIHRPAFPIDTLRRVAILVERGYRITSVELLKLHSLILADIHAHKMKAYRFGEAA